MYWLRGQIIVLFVTISCLLAQSQALSVRIVEGGGAINSIRYQRGHDLVVQVLDESERPVTDAAVTFLLPASGASGTFGDGSLSVTVTTDEHGLAAARGLKPNRIAGQFRIRATASWRGASAHAAILQTNAEPAANKGRGKWVIIALAVGGAAAGGAVAAASGGSKSSTTSPATVPAPAASSISSGTPAFGPPR